jgi:threonine/homoserine/homoserine lactone efflux protein
MTVPSAIASFALVAGVLTIIPGLDTALVLRAAVMKGRRHAFATAVGISTGALLWGALAALGATAVLTASHVAYTALRIAGALYLTWIGVSMLRHSFAQRSALESDNPQSAVSDSTLLRSWTRGLTTNLLNPKIGVFYMAMLPQFIPQNSSHLLMGLALAGVHDAEGLVWFTGLIFSAHLAGRWLRGGAAHRILDRITGCVLIGFGIKLASE